MAEDSPAAPLPRRVPGSRHLPGGKQGTGPVGPAALSGEALQRIRDALGSPKDEASPQEPTVGAKPAARAGRRAPLPRRVPGAGKGPKPPAVIARPRLAFLPPSRTHGAITGEFPAIGAVRSDGGTEEITAQPATTALPEPAATVPTDSIVAPQPMAEEQTGQHNRPDKEKGHPEKAPAHQENGQASRAKAPAGRTKRPGRRAQVLARSLKPALPKRPSRLRKPVSAAKPVPQLALVFPEDPAPEEVTIRSATLIRPLRADRRSGIVWAILVLALILGSIGFVMIR